MTGSSVSPSVRLSVYISVYLSVCMSTCLSLCMFLYSSVHLQPVSLSICLSISPSLRQSYFVIHSSSLLPCITELEGIPQLSGRPWTPGFNPKVHGKAYICRESRFGPFAPWIQRRVLTLFLIYRRGFLVRHSSPVRRQHFPIIKEEFGAFRRKMSRRSKPNRYL